MEYYPLYQNDFNLNDLRKDETSSRVGLACANEDKLFRLLGMK